jgi:RNA polymerase sigma-70 factor (ECF subfamily)
VIVFESKHISVEITDNQKLLAIIQGCMNQNPQSQALLYKQFYGYAMRICLRYSSNYEEAVEVLNDGFLKIFTKLKLYNPEMSFPGWVRRIMINTALNHYKKNQKYYQNYQIEQIADEPAQEVVMQKFAQEELADLIQQLSPVYRTVFNLYAIDGYKHEEIAEMLNISVGTSKSNLSKARANLREMLLKKKLVNEYAQND